MQLISDFVVYGIWKESLNNDGQNFHQYQQNEHSSLISADFTEHNNKNTTYDVGTTGSDLGTAHTCNRN
jgi:hypothetical protein